MLNLQILFEIIGKAYVEILGGLIRKQRGIDEIAYVPVEIRVRSKKGKMFTRKRKRLVDTGQYNRNAFISEVNENTLTIKGTPDTEHITAYNDRDSIYLSGKHGATIKIRGPKIFPWTEAEFIASYNLETGRDFYQDISDDLKAQVLAELERELPDKIEIQL